MLNSRNTTFDNISAKTYRTISILKREIEAGRHEDLKKVQLVERLTFVLGYMVDLASNRSDETLNQEKLEKLMATIWDHSNILIIPEYFQRRFGRDNLGDLPFATVWAQVKQIEAEYDRAAAT